MHQRAAAVARPVIEQMPSVTGSARNAPPYGASRGSIMSKLDGTRRHHVRELGSAAGVEFRRAIKERVSTGRNGIEHLLRYQRTRRERALVPARRNTSYAPE